MSAVKKELRVPKRTMTNDPAWQEMVKVRLPKARKGEDKTEFVSVNGKAYWVPKGKEVIVPRPIAEILDRMAHYRDITEDIIANLPTNESLSDM